MMWALAGLAWAEEPVDTEAQAPSPAYEIGGYLAPEFVALSRPDGLPRDEQLLGMRDAAAGLELTVDPSAAWSFLLRLVFSPVSVPVVDRVEALDLDNDGSIDAVETSEIAVIAQVVDEGFVHWQPTPWVGGTVGRFRVPFTVEAEWSDADLLFGSRTVPTQLFFDESDLGATLDVTTHWAQARAGFMNGTGSTVGIDDTRGILWMGRFDATPLGPIPDDPFISTGFLGRLGGAVTYHPYTTYDDTGYPDLGTEDLRLSGSLQARFYGLGVLLETLRRMEVDTLTARPETATGSYGQASYLFLFGVQPLVRYSVASWDETFDLRRGRWLDVGVNLYPLARSEDPSRVRVTTLFIAEDRSTEGERAYGGDVQVLFMW